VRNQLRHATQARELIERETAIANHLAACTIPKLRALLREKLLQVHLVSVRLVEIALLHHKTHATCTHTHTHTNTHAHTPACPHGEQVWLEGIGGVAALLRDGRTAELAEWFTTYACLPECLGAIEGPFLERMSAIHRDFCKSSVPSLSLSDYLKLVRTRGAVFTVMRLSCAAHYVT
jgi:hypothetical protein